MIMESLIMLYFLQDFVFSLKEKKAELDNKKEVLKNIAFNNIVLYSYYCISDNNCQINYFPLQSVNHS